MNGRILGQNDKKQLKKTKKHIPELGLFDLVYTHT